MISSKFSLTLASIAVIASSAGAQTAPARPKITSVSHLSVYTSDAAKTETFYVHDLGATKGTDMKAGTTSTNGRVVPGQFSSQAVS